MAAETVRNVLITIPDVHSRMKFEPRYVLPLVQRLWRGKLRDEADPIRVLPTPKHMAGEQLRVCDCRSEFNRLKVTYATDPANGSPVFESVYPLYEDFERAFTSAVEEVKRGTAKSRLAKVDPEAAAGMPDVDADAASEFSVTVESQE